MILRNILHPNEHITKARFSAIFSDAWNKTAPDGRAAKDFECTGIMPSSVTLRSKDVSETESSKAVTTTRRSE
jgi:hypothetical protein